MDTDIRINQQEKVEEEEERNTVLSIIAGCESHNEGKYTYYLRIFSICVCTPGKWWVLTFPLPPTGPQEGR